MGAATVGGDGGGTITPLPPDAQGLPPPTPQDTTAIRCVVCGVDWPTIPALFGYGSKDTNWIITEADVDEFMQRAVDNRLPCPVCEDECSMATNLNPLPDDEAWSLKNHADFERYYERTRGVAP